MPRTNTADIAPVSTYQWTNSEQTCLRRTDADGSVVVVPADEANSDYAAYLASGEEALPYVEPPPPEPLTTEQKVDNMLSAFGLSREEMITALQAKKGG